MDQGAWEQSVDSHKVSTLIVHDAGLIVFNETQSFADSPNANDSIDSAREKLARAVINGDDTADASEPVTPQAVVDGLMKN